MRRKLRFGEFSREPLQLLRLEWKVELLECDWLMRPADPFDSELPRHLVDEHQTQQALRDALSLRDVVFKSFPGVNTAELRMFRTGADERPELMMTGSVNRTNEALARVPSVAMRARLCGFNFNLAQGVLERMSPVSAACS
ncbi:MAG TPA: hypothetical protein VMV57_13985 [Terracidiphilus sp.]|nr:hypothetical protein [Terracidiphilus sp.]